MKYRLASILALIVAVACRGAASPEGSASLSIRTDRSEYRRLDRIVVTTTNETGEVVYDDHCTGEVQGFELLDRWNASYGMARECSWPDASRWRDYSVEIPAGTAHVDTFHVSGVAYTGTWRIELGLRDAAGRTLSAKRRVSNTFTVQAP